MMNLETARQVFNLTHFNDTLGSLDNLIEANLLDKETSWQESGNFIRDAKVKYNPLDDAKIGDGVTLNYYSDSDAATIISRTENTITFRLDKSTLINKDVLKFSTGGFVAHCENQGEQEYEYEADVNGAVYTASRRKDGLYRLKGKGKDACVVSSGRRTFYDYNF